MSDKKHIDRIFQEGFKDFEANPPAEVWDNIQAALKKEEKDDRKIIPIWWRVGGVAALLALLLTVGGVFWPDSDQNNSFSNEAIDQMQQIDTQDQIKDQKTIEEMVKENEADAIAEQQSDDQQINSSEKPSAADAKIGNSKQRDAVADNTNKSKTLIDKSAVDKSLNTVTTAVTSNDSSTEQDKTATSNSETTAVTATDNTENTVVNDKTADALLETQTNTATTTASTDNSENKTDPEAQKDEDGKISIFDAIEEQKDIETATLLDQQDPIDNRWSVAPQVAPVVYGSFGEGSTVGAEFADNRTSSDANLSYGVQVQYQVNNRLAVRSGVNRVNLSVNTNDIEFAVAPAAFDVGSKFVNGNIAYTVGDKGTLINRFAQAAPTEGLDLPEVNAFEGLLNQQFEYWEVPVELSYAVLNNRFKVNVFGGFSTLFLQDNSITAISGQRETELGSVGNLNSLSFTTNVGLGLQYDISKRFAINVEPVFKYQLNPYTDSSIGSQPYYMGVYSGLRFKF